ncbi:uncharacterized protein LOC129596691 isoform X2 [Paramacrobiotus metropolitanus]|uniref:uncharacterized protein LOC129596691 isoform X2 n=1 Tax=Paramacrobiotus metropolitanus TaxID=2943436 RepID=UPI0024464CCE|nr:uncharacterized protein LOC129596691 isoform X2 [Paramacrobiotus metropolitanus]
MILSRMSFVRCDDHNDPTAKREQEGKHTSVSIIALTSSAFIKHVSTDKTTQSRDANATLETECPVFPTNRAPAMFSTSAIPAFRSDPLPPWKCPDIPGCSIHCSYIHGFFVLEKGDSTYLNVQCFGNRSTTIPVFTQLLRNHSDRALTVMLADLSHRMDALHPDVLQPIKRNLIDLEINYCGVSATRRLYDAGVLSNLISLKFAVGLDLRIGERDFSRLPQIRRIVFSELTIASIEPYTFTNLPHLRTLNLEEDLDHVEYEIEREEFAKDKYGTLPQRGKLMQQVYERRCNCSYAWLRNLFRRKPDLWVCAEKERSLSLATILLCSPLAAF